MPTVNIPATPPARNASRTARRRPDSRAAFAVRTLARTASHIPTYPVTIDARAPRRNAIDRPNRMLSALCSAFFGTGSTKKSTTARTARNTASVRYWRLRYAFAPSWIARAISFIFSVPSGAASTSRTRYQAKSNATSETPKMSHRARFSPDPNRAWIGPLSWASQPTIEPPTSGTTLVRAGVCLPGAGTRRGYPSPRRADLRLRQTRRAGSPGRRAGSPAPRTPRARHDDPRARGPTPRTRGGSCRPRD